MAKIQTRHFSRRFGTRHLKLAPLVLASALVVACGGADEPAPGADAGDTGGTTAAPDPTAAQPGTPTAESAVASEPGWLEAEAARVGGGARVLDTGSASGARSVGWMHLAGAFVEFEVDGGTSGGEFDLQLRYANGNDGERNLSIYANGTRQVQAQLDSTGGWTMFKQSAVARVKLQAGRNVIRIQRDPSDEPSADLDRIKLVPAARNSAPPVSVPVAPPPPAAPPPPPAPAEPPPANPGNGSAPPTSGSNPAGRPVVNTALIPPARPGSSTVDIAFTGEMPKKDAGGIGAFRNVCQFSHMNFDDAIVFPGRQNASHLHTYFGNTGARFDTTPSSLRSSGNGTCRGGIANRSAYWVPSMIDTRAGRPLAPEYINIYYKTGYNGIADAAVKPWPAGFRMIAGDSSSTSAQTGIVSYQCNGGSASTTIPACSGTLSMSVRFPQCWDGSNLDSPDHRSHVAYPSGGRCPATHPVPTPELSLQVFYKTTFGDSSTWRLSSDMNGAPAGSSGHADWMNGWDPELMKVWVAKVINTGLSGGSHMIGDGRAMTCKFPGCI